MKRFLYLFITSLLLVVFLGGCSAGGESPEETTADKKVSGDITEEETSEKKTTEKQTEEKTEDVSAETGKTDETSTAAVEKKKINRAPVNCDHIDPSKPMVALTFDDGPSSNTPRLLNILKQYGAKATFFVVGEQIKGNEALLKRMVTEGHEVASHTWSHPNLATSSQETVESQLRNTRQAIKKATGVDAPLARPPYGSCNDAVKNIAAKQGISFIMWSLDTRDWESRNAMAVYSKTMSNVNNGDIILCHDLHKTTVDAMESVIPSLIQNGYQLVTVSELLTYGREELTCGEVYYNR